MEKINHPDIKEEEARRNRNWDAQQRWEAILKTIEWAEAQQPVTRNSKKACLEKQTFLNRSLSN
jgi:N-acetylmuramoyl-L-alanine amidase CwlA